MNKQLAFALFLGANFLYPHWISAQNSSQNAATQCVAPNAFVALPVALAGSMTTPRGDTTAALGSYERISPDGRFVMRSYSGARLGDVSIVEFTAPSADGATPEQVHTIYQTPFSEEAFPVQGSWRYLINTNGDHYRLRDVINLQRQAKPLFRAGMTGFYAAAAEVQGTAPGRIGIRSMSWPNANSAGDDQGQGALVERTVEVDTATDKLVADSGTHTLCADRRKQDGSMYALPMVAVSGLEFAALPQLPVQGEAKMRIYGFGPTGSGCEAKVAFPFATGKVTFGYPDPLTGLADLVWEYKGQIWWYNRQLQQAFNIAPYLTANGPVRNLEANAFPGMTRTGQVIYGAMWDSCDASGHCQRTAGYVLADPRQSNAYKHYLYDNPQTQPLTCIAPAQVLQARQDFAKARGLEN